jgi:ABC-type branched-subunit amino acid transport system ATPase component
MNENAFSIKKLYKHFGGVAAIDTLSLSFVQGSLTGVVGPNGSGKSTLINVLTGLVPIDGGEVILSGNSLFRILKSHAVAELGITRTFQEVRLFEQLSVLDNVLVVLTERSVFSALFERHGAFHLSRAQEVLERVGLWHKRYALANTLSYGERKLLEIARVLAMKADTIFFDEPFAGLFPEMVKLVSDIFVELKKEGKTLILVEHDMELIRTLTDYVFVLDAGKLLAEGKPQEVLRRKEVIEAYLGQ